MKTKTNQLLTVAALATGSGTTVAALYRATRDGGLRGRVEIGLIVATKIDAGVISRLIAAGFPRDHIVVIDPRDCRDRDQWGERVFTAVIANGCQHLGLYGCLVKLPASLVEALAHMGIVVTNQHPGWLPWFGGEGFYAEAPVAAQLAFARLVSRPFMAGAVCQYVDPDTYDGGSVLVSAGVTIEPRDTVASLQARLLSVEHGVQIAALMAASEGRLSPTPTPDIVRDDEMDPLLSARMQALMAYPGRGWKGMDECVRMARAIPGMEIR